jgi:hypothetical protein
MGMCWVVQLEPTVESIIELCRRVSVEMSFLCTADSQTILVNSLFRKFKLVIFVLHGHVHITARNIEGACF